MILTQKEVQEIMTHQEVFLDVVSDLEVALSFGSTYPVSTDDVKVTRALGFAIGRWNPPYTHITEDQRGWDTKKQCWVKMPPTKN